MYISILFNNILTQTFKMVILDKDGNPKFYDITTKLFKELTANNPYGYLELKDCYREEIFHIYVEDGVVETITFVDGLQVMA